MAAGLRKRKSSLCAVEVRPGPRARTTQSAASAPRPTPSALRRYWRRSFQASSVITSPGNEACPQAKTAAIQTKVFTLEVNGSGAIAAANCAGRATRFFYEEKRFSCRVRSYDVGPAGRVVRSRVAQHAISAKERRHERKDVYSALCGGPRHPRGCGGWPRRHEAIKRRAVVESSSRCDRVQEGRA